MQAQSRLAIVALIKEELIFIEDNQQHSQDHNSLYTRILRNIQIWLKTSRVLLFADRCSYKRDLMQFCMAKKIPYKEITTTDTWLRDYLFETPKQLYIRNKASSYGCFDDNPAIDWTPRMSPEHLRNLDDVLFTDKGYLHKTNRCLEGGNLFAVCNTKGEKYYIIGSSVVLFEKMFLENKYNIKATTRDIIERYKKIFGTKNIVTIPNLSYHIDLQMAYVGQGTFLIHSFDEMRKNFPADYRQYLNKYGGQNPDFITAMEAAVKKIVEFLETLNFNAIKFCGNLYHEGKMDVFSGGGLKSTFVNGIDVYSEYEKQNYFVTIDSDVIAHKQYFIRLMEPLKIEPYFVTNQSGNIRKTINEISERSGALRCQTNFIDADKVAWERQPQQISA